ncbi:RNA pseudouridine synthase [Lentimicrobium sp. L6]|nr:MULTISPECIES: RNA pseudouridine synthase [unclassified Lentimicrobium]NPD44275.1 RNA pseudouridine synthase [Lentimicrobium sp. S6]NPD86181.1 RNA pseudouridine synthase [Lentimicrobium sp. L6]
MGHLEQKYNIDVVFEDNHLIVINKKPGQIAQGDKTGDEPLNEILKAYLKEKYDKPGNVYLGLVHRLDRPTSGGLVFGKTDKASSRLSKMFQTREVKKTYWAVVDHRPPLTEDTLEHYLIKNQEKNKSAVAKPSNKNGKKAILHYKYLSSIDKYHLLEITLETGRHHQIRAQLAKIGCHIKGDVKYGFKRGNQDQSIHLHARYMEFIHPVKKENMRFEFALPEDVVWKAFL